MIKKKKKKKKYMDERNWNRRKLKRHTNSKN